MLRYLTLALLGLLASSISHAEEALRFSTFAMQPYSYVENKEKKGLFVEFAKLFEEQANIPISIRLLPTKRLRKSILEGSTDCSLFIKSPAIGKDLVAVADTGIRLKSSILSTRENPVEAYEDLYNRTLGVGIGTIFGHKIDTDPKLKKANAKGYDEIARMLKVGRVDAILGVEISLKYNLRQIDYQMDKLAEPYVLHSKELWLFCSKKAAAERPETIQKLKNAIVQLRQNKRLQSRLDNFFDTKH